jgi:hypothetical protein
MSEIHAAPQNPAEQIGSRAVGECVLWDGPVDRGYGVRKSKGVRIFAHRASWERANGRRLREGEVVCHRCDNPLCVNPDHLWAGTQRQNMLDMYAKGRGGVHTVYGERAAQAKLTAAQAAAIKLDARPNAVIARDYSIGVTAISCIKAGKTWVKAIALHNGEAA